MPPIRSALFLATALLALAACKEEPQTSPAQTYLDYYAVVIEGRSFEQDVGYQAKARRDAVTGQLDARAASTGQTVEMLKTMYLNFTQALARCGDLTLEDETIDGDTATVVFAVKDTCDGGQQDGRLVIEMVNEDGWKIVSDALSIGG